jgi:predicted dehydrogenase
MAQKFAVIGVGYWGRKHVDEYTLHGEKVIAVDPVEANRIFCAEKFKCETSGDYRKVLSDPSVFGVSICTPNETHYLLAKEAFESGKHVLLEKPITMNYEQAVELVELARKKKLVFAIGHLFRFNNSVKWTKDAIESGFFGKIFLIKLAWTNLEPVWQNRDILFDLGPHPFDILHFLFNSYPTEISCIGSAMRKEKGEEAAFVNCKVNEVLADLEISWVTPDKARKLTIVGSDRTAFVDCLAQEVRVYENSSGNTAKLEVTPSNTLGDEIAHFVECSRKGEINYADGRIGSEVVRIIETAKKAMQEARTMSLIS